MVTVLIYNRPLLLNYHTSTTTSMAPPVYLALVLLFFPTVIFAEPLHVPIARRRQIATRDWNQEANRLRKRYGYRQATSPPSHRSNRRGVADIPVFDQVDIVIVLFYNQLITRIGSRF